MNWRGRSLTDIATIIELISATTTNNGLTVEAIQDLNTYQTGINYDSAAYDNLPVEPHPWHGDWNYTIHPTNRAT